MKPSKLTLILILVLIMIGIITYIILVPKVASQLVVSPNISQVFNKPSPSPENVTPFNSYNPPKEIKYNANTNLKKELDGINPQILDEDFEPLTAKQL